MNATQRVPGFVQIGTHVINLAQIAYMDLQAFDSDHRRFVRVVFAAVSADGYSLSLVFGGEEYQRALLALSDALVGWMAEPESSEEPTP